MEFKDLIAVFQKQKLTFFAITGLFLALSFVWYARQSVSYEASLLLNIGRSGVSNASDYTYDSFYRLQADERFSDTVVRWLASPRVVEDIYEEAKTGDERRSGQDWSGTFVSARLSSQVISVQYGGSDKKELEELARAMIAVLNRYTKALNTSEQEKSWFVILESSPVIRDSRTDLQTTLVVALIVGLFVSFWIVLARHYFSRD
jgi:capsular polysaccharide biosynthesis protein